MSLTEQLFKIIRFKPAVIPHESHKPKIPLIPEKEKKPLENLLDKKEHIQPKPIEAINSGDSADEAARKKAANKEAEVFNKKIPALNKAIDAENLKIDAKNKTIEEKNELNSDHNQRIDDQNAEIIAKNAKIDAENAEIDEQNKKIDQLNQSSQRTFKSTQMAMLQSCFEQSRFAGEMSQLATTETTSELASINWADARNILLTAVQEKLPFNLVKAIYVEMARVHLAKFAGYPQAVEVLKALKIKFDDAQKQYPIDFKAAGTKQSSDDKTNNPSARQAACKENYEGKEGVITKLTQEIQKVEAQLTSLQPVVIAIEQVKATFEYVVAQLSTPESFGYANEFIKMMSSELTSNIISWGGAEKANPFTEQLFKLIQLQPKKAEEQKPVTTTNDQAAASSSSFFSRFSFRAAPIKKEVVPPQAKQELTEAEIASFVSFKEDQINLLFKLAGSWINFADNRNVLLEAIKQGLPFVSVNMIYKQMVSLDASAKLKFQQAKEGFDAHKVAHAALTTPDKQSAYLKANEQEIIALKAAMAAFRKVNSTILGHLKATIEHVAAEGKPERFDAYMRMMQPLLAEGVITWTDQKKANPFTEQLFNIIQSKSMEDAKKADLINSLFDSTSSMKGVGIDLLDARNILRAAIQHKLPFDSVVSIYNKMAQAFVDGGAYGVYSQAMNEYRTLAEEHAQLKETVQSLANPKSGEKEDKTAKATREKRCVEEKKALEQSKENMQAHFKKNIEENPTYQWLVQIKDTANIIAAQKTSTDFESFMGMIKRVKSDMIWQAASIKDKDANPFNAAFHTNQHEMIAHFFKKPPFEIVTAQIANALAWLCQSTKDMPEMTEVLISGLSHKNVLELVDSPVDGNFLKRSDAVKGKSLAEHAWSNGLVKVFKVLVLNGASLGNLLSHPKPAQFSPALQVDISKEDVRVEMNSILECVKAVEMAKDKFYASQNQDVQAVTVALPAIKKASVFFIEYLPVIAKTELLEKANEFLQFLQTLLALNPAVVRAKSTTTMATSTISTEKAIRDAVECAILNYLDRWMPSLEPAKLNAEDLQLFTDVRAQVNGFSGAVKEAHKRLYDNVLDSLNELVPPVLTPASTPKKGSSASSSSAVSSPQVSTSAPTPDSDSEDAEDPKVAKLEAKLAAAKAEAKAAKAAARAKKVGSPKATQQPPVVTQPTDGTADAAIVETTTNVQPKAATPPSAQVNHLFESDKDEDKGFLGDTSSEAADSAPLAQPADEAYKTEKDAVRNAVDAIANGQGFMAPVAPANTNAAPQPQEQQQPQEQPRVAI